MQTLEASRPVFFNLFIRNGTTWSVESILEFTSMCLYITVA